MKYSSLFPIGGVWAKSVILPPSAIRTVPLVIGRSMKE